MTRRLKMSHADHVAFAAKVRPAERELSEIHLAVSHAFGVTHPATRALAKALQKLGDAKSKLDDEYYAVTSPEQFKERGWVYYKRGPTDPPRRCAQGENRADRSGR